MSEYQYYEFHAVDRSLSDDEMRALRELSSRATITPTSFVNVYNYGDFRGNPSELMERFFDLHVYVTNWGTNVLMIRVPSSLLDIDVARTYAPDEPVVARSHGGHTIIELQSDIDDYFDWIEGDGWMGRLRPLRDELIAGDLRPLYLGWLLLAMYDEPDSEEMEPPVPPGLGQLSPAQQALAELMRIDPILIEVAAERSGALPDTAPRDDELRAWISGLPAAEKDDLLVSAMRGDDAQLGALLLKDFRESTSPATPGSTATAARRTSGELVAAWKMKAAAYKRAEEEREAKKHAAHMRDITDRAEDLWREADALAENRNLKSYNVAIEHLSNLHAAAKHFGTLEEFERRLERLEAKHSRKSSFVNLLKTVGAPRPASSYAHVSWTLDRS